MTGLAWLNGVFVAADEARISPFDRGFLFADGVYEVTAVYGGRLIDMERHLDRLERSLRELAFGAAPDRQEIEAAHRRLVAENGVDEGYVYLQVTRGAYGGRDFTAPAQPRLTCFAFTEKRALVDTPSARNGSKVIAAPDIRWGRRDIKTVQLLASALAKTEAKRQGKDDAWLVAPDGTVTEGASSNAWIVTGAGEIVTRALSADILAGVTRHAIFDAVSQAGGLQASPAHPGESRDPVSLDRSGSRPGSGPGSSGRAENGGLRLIERRFSLDEAKAAVEAFSTAATGLVTPVVEIDGVALADGRPGKVTRAVQRLYYQALGVDVAKAAPWVLQD